MIELPFHSPSGFAGAASGPESGDGHWFLFCGDRLLVEIGPPSSAPSGDMRVAARPEWARLPSGVRPLPDVTVERTIHLGTLAGVSCFAAEIPAGTPTPRGWSWEGLRTLFSVLDDAQFALAGRAVQLVDWDRTHRFCGRCGAPTEPKPEEHVRACPACRLTVYPRIAPAVMALIRRDREILLGRSPHFPKGMFSALAGFVEPGESLEQCVAREVREEVGVEVANIRYFASQPWPFPHSLMIAFVCDWAGGEIRPAPGEIEAAEWFEVFHLPRLPSKISIARGLIDAVSGEMRESLSRNGEAGGVDRRNLA